MGVYIIVPDGLAADKNGNAIPKPSFVFQSVLDYVVSIASQSDIVYIAPANNFGCILFEQEVALKYLRERMPSNQIVSSTIANKGYIDTFGNAEYLKTYLQHDPSKTHFELVCSEIHSYRAQLCFAINGYSIRHVHRVKYHNSKEPVVRRLWYYRHPIWYVIYEGLAIFREIFLFPFKSLRS